jgi:[ribosomal protein S18]-alanine N-acetyltransferase
MNVDEEAYEPSIRRAGPGDIETAMSIDAECLPVPWSQAVWRDELESPFSTYLFLENDEGVVGQIGVKRVLDEAHVTTVAVRPRYRRRGYARTLLSAALRESARRVKLSRVHLEVRPSNRAARALYESLGFTVAGRRPRYYGDEDAFLMTLNL